MSMRPELCRRLGHAFSMSFPTPEERARVTAAANDRHVATFADLPAEIQRLVRRLEA